MHSEWIRSAFLRVLIFLQIKDRGPYFCGKPILQNVWIIWSLLLYFNLKSSMGPNSLSFITFECILHDSRVLFSESWYLYMLKTEDLISGANQFCRRSELFGPSSCISILKVLWTQILHHSSGFSNFIINQGNFSQSPWISRDERGENLFHGETNFAECLNYFVPVSPFQS